MISLRTLITFAVLMITIVLIRDTQAAPSCTVPRTHVNAEDCKYGTYLDWCRNTKCAKGPGKSCGGDWWEHGVCGKGTYCACGFCSGCSENLECSLGSFC